LYGDDIPEKPAKGFIQRWWEKRLEGKRYSPSKLAIALSDYTALLWLGLLIEKSAMLLSKQQWHITSFLQGWKGWLTLSFVGFSLVYAIDLFSRCHSEKS